MARRPIPWCLIDSQHRERAAGTRTMQWPAGEMPLAYLYWAMAREVSGPVWFFTSIYVCCINSHRARAADTPRQLMNKYFIVDGLASGRAAAPPRRPAWLPPRTRREARARSPPPIRPRPGPVPARPGRPRPRPPAGPASPGLHFITLYNTTYTAARAAHRYGSGARA